MVTKSERNGPVFRFFMDLGDAGMIENCFITLYIFSWVGKDSNIIPDFWKPLFFSSLMWTLVEMNTPKFTYLLLWMLIMVRPISAYMSISCMQ